MLIPLVIKIVRQTVLRFQHWSTCSFYYYQKYSILLNMLLEKIKYAHTHCLTHMQERILNN